jgi:hypothetical protein
LLKIGFWAEAIRGLMAGMRCVADLQQLCLLGSFGFGWLQCYLYPLFMRPLLG